ncbi:MAG: 50S ribosomal protein L11 methyltransferase [Deltaproteobacteria bacterium]|nr:50S ribosomal protein L11 methyltransferase [Deltaproteobacteria bacterium]
MEQYFLNYESIPQQRWMVSDQARTSAFKQAIAEVVKPGDVVIDVGAGTGILSIFAAQAGARRVIAIERSGMAQLARQLIAHNGLQDIIEVFEGDAHDLVLDEKADVIVSEWLGHMAFVENMFEAVRAVRDAHLKPGGIMLPSDVQVFLAPVQADRLYYEDGPGFWEREPVHGIDFSCFTLPELEMGYSSRYSLPPQVLLAPGETLKALRTETARPGDEWGEGTLHFTMARDGVINGFLGWFSAQLSPSVLLQTSPEFPNTHWDQTSFPFHPIAVKAGETVAVKFYMYQAGESDRLMEMTLRAGDKTIRYVVD